MTEKEREIRKSEVARLYLAGVDTSSIHHQLCIPQSTVFQIIAKMHKSGKLPYRISHKTKRIPGFDPTVYDDDYEPVPPDSKDN